jgi:hypothetical protein
MGLEEAVLEEWRINITLLPKQVNMDITGGNILQYSIRLLRNILLVFYSWQEFGARHVHFLLLCGLWSKAVSLLEERQWVIWEGPSGVRSSHVRPFGCLAPLLPNSSSIPAANLAASAKRIARNSKIKGLSIINVAPTVLVTLHWMILAHLRHLQSLNWLFGDLSQPFL